MITSSLTLVTSSQVYRYTLALVEKPSQSNVNLNKGSAWLSLTRRFARRVGVRICSNLLSGGYLLSGGSLLARLSLLSRLSLPLLCTVSRSVNLSSSYIRMGVWSHSLWRCIYLLLFNHHYNRNKQQQWYETAKITIQGHGVIMLHQIKCYIYFIEFWRTTFSAEAIQCAYTHIQSV